MGKAGNKTGSDRIRNPGDDDGDRFTGALRRLSRLRIDGENRVDLQTDELTGEPGKSRIVPFREAPFEFQIPAFHVTVLTQTIAEGFQGSERLASRIQDSDKSELPGRLSFGVEGHDEKQKSHGKERDACDLQERLSRENCTDPPRSQKTTGSVTGRLRLESRDDCRTNVLVFSFERQREQRRRRVERAWKSACLERCTWPEAWLAFTLCGAEPSANSFLLNGAEIDASRDEQERVMLALAAGRLDRGQLAEWVRQHLKSLA